MYENKYLKYKTKYLELKKKILMKNANSTIMTGGTNKKDIMDIEKLTETPSKLDTYGYEMINDKLVFKEDIIGGTNELHKLINSNEYNNSVKKENVEYNTDELFMEGGKKKYKTVEKKIESDDESKHNINKKNTKKNELESESSSESTDSDLFSSGSSNISSS